MVPVGMRQKDIGGGGLFGELVAEHAYSGAGVENQVVSVFEFDMHAGGIAAVFCSRRTRNRRGAANTGPAVLIV